MCSNWSSGSDLYLFQEAGLKPATGHLNVVLYGLSLVWKIVWECCRLACFCGKAPCSLGCWKSSSFYGNWSKVFVWWLDPWPLLSNLYLKLNEATRGKWQCMCKRLDVLDFEGVANLPWKILVWLSFFFFPLWLNLKGHWFGSLLFRSWFEYWVCMTFFWKFNAHLAWCFQLQVQFSIGVFCSRWCYYLCFAGNQTLANKLWLDSVISRLKGKLNRIQIFCAVKSVSTFMFDFGINQQCKFLFSRFFSHQIGSFLGDIDERK